jgi:WD40 repeat protein
MSRPFRISPLNILSSVALAACFLASGKPTSAGIFAASKNDVAIKVADLPTRPDHILFPFSAVYALGLDFGPDGSRLAVESNSGKIYIWDWRNKRIEKTIEMPKGFGNGLTKNPIQYSPDGLLLVVCDGKAAGEVVARIWNTTDWSIAKDITDAGSGGCDAISFMPDGKSLVYLIDRVGDPGNSLIAYAVNTWQPIWGLAMPGFSPVSMAISPNGEQAAVAGTIFVAPPGAVDPIQRSQQTRTELQVRLVDVQQHKPVTVVEVSAMGPLAWSPDSVRVAAVGAQHAGILDIKSGNTLVQEKIEKSGTMNVRFSSDGRYLIESDLNGMGKGLGVSIWDSQRKTLLQHIPAGDVGSISVSRDGRLLAVGEAGRTTIWQFK